MDTAAGAVREVSRRRATENSNPGGLRSRRRERLKSKTQAQRQATVIKENQAVPLNNRCL